MAQPLVASTDAASHWDLYLYQNKSMTKLRHEKRRGFAATGFQNVDRLRKYQACGTEFSLIHFYKLKYYENFTDITQLDQSNGQLNSF
jgi:hypothetical protein